MRSIRFGFGLLIAIAICAAPAIAQEKKDEGKPAAKQDAPKKDDGAKKEEPKAAGGAKIGEAAPAFELTDSNGKKVKLADYKDKIVVLQWLNKDCPYCVKAAPKLKETADKYLAKGVVWLGVDTTFNHTASDANEYIKDKGFAFPVLMDTDGTVGKAYGAKTTPHIFIIQNGKLVYKGAHDDKGSRNYVSESLDALLAGKAVPVAETEPYGCTVKYKK